MTSGEQEPPINITVERALRDAGRKRAHAPEGFVGNVMRRIKQQLPESPSEGHSLHT